MEERPVIDIEMSGIYNFIENAATIVSLITFAAAFYYYFDLPEIVPIHFNLSGEADGYGEKIYIFLSPLLAIIFNFSLRLLNKYPHKFNYLIRITKENAYFQYKKAKEFIIRLNFILCLLFVCTTYNMIFYDKIESELNSILPVILISGGSLALIIHYLFVSSNKNT